MKKALILFSEIGPYHAARISALYDSLREHGVDLYAFRFAAKSCLYSWTPNNLEAVPTITLLDRPPQKTTSYIHLSIKFFLAVRNLGVDYAFLPSYYPLPNLLCLIAAKLCGCRIILMTESWDQTANNRLFPSIVKRLLVSLFDSALVGGTPQAKYIESLGMPASSIFHGYDVIDVNYFAGFNLHKADPTLALRTGLPKRYFLSLGRFVEKKNLNTLLKAYSIYASSAYLNRRPVISLVIVGDGPLDLQLRSQASSLGLLVREGSDIRQFDSRPVVVFFTFQQIHLIPLFYCLSEAFILPSHYEEWGLVVNEALACRTAVIVSSNVGSRFDLIEDNVSGLVFNPSSPEQLAVLLTRFDQEPSLRERLALCGFNRIKSWTPTWFASQAIQALLAASK